MVPKFYAIDRAEAVARRVAGPLQAFSVLFHPFIVALSGVADRSCASWGDMSLERRGGSTDELKRLIAESHEAGRSTRRGGHADGVFHLHEQEARQVMTPAPAW